MNNLELTVVKVDGTDKWSLLDALRKLAEIDADFNGDNGSEYFWEEVKSFNDKFKENIVDYFDSNMEYLLNELKDLDGEELVHEYLEKWIGRDGYWTDYKYEVISNNNIITSISLATLS